MSKSILRLIVVGLMALSLVLAACGPAATPSAPSAPTAPASAPAPPASETKPVEEKPQQEAVKPAADKPKYGGTLNLVMNGDVVNWDPQRNFAGTVWGLEQEQLFQGDWTKGPAGGYGTDETDWGAANNDLFDLKTGYIGADWSWKADPQTDTGTVTYKIRKGIHWALNPKSEASQLVNGRELTVDDVIFSSNRTFTWNLSGLYAYYTELRNLPISKTGPDEMTITIKGVNNLITLVSRSADLMFIVAPEVIRKYGDMQDWRRQEGTGPFMLTDVVASSQMYFVRNPNYWLKDPIGPGKGNQLPYLDAVRILIVPDASTRLAALRTGKIDNISGISREDAIRLKQTTPKLVSKMYTSNQGRGTPLGMKLDKPELPWAPQDDPNALKVRRAMMMAIDFQAILKNYYGGEGQIVTYPFSYVKEYGELYIGLDDLQFPESAKELYSYNTEKAKQLLKEAGYPNGFKTSVVLTSTEVDYYAIIKDYWSRVGIDLAFDIKDTATKNTINREKSFPELMTGTTGPVAAFYSMGNLQGPSMDNRSNISDPWIDKKLDEVRIAALTDMHKAMQIYRDIFIYAQDKVYAIPNVIGSQYYFWWPWLKNYSGEQNVGFDSAIYPMFIWYDQELKKSMGY